MRILLTSHKYHVFQEVCESWPFRWIIIAANIDSKGAVSHSITVCLLIVVVILNQEAVDSVRQDEHLYADNEIKIMIELWNVLAKLV